jgi:hypothetical protein
MNNIINEEIFLLGIIDNIHDFYEDKKSLKLMINFIDFIYVKSTKIIINNIDIINYYNILLKNIIDVNNKHFRKIMSDLILKKTYVEINGLNNNITENFDDIFNVSIKSPLLNPNINVNIKNLLNKENKLKLRNQLYYLIELYKYNPNNNDITKLILFILDYINFNIFNEKIIDKIIKAVKNNLHKFIKLNKINYNYPITYFDDTTCGLDKDLINFHIINLDKDKIDGAKTISPKTYLSKPTLKNIHLINDNSIGFKITPDLKIKYLDFVYYFNGVYIICEYKFNNKIFIFSFIDNTINEILNIVGYLDIIIKNIKNNSTKEILKLNIFKVVNKKEIDTFITNLISLYIIFNNRDIFKGFLICLLFGLKRFGDWIQMEASKKYYFFVQTCDFYAKLYGYLIDAPIIINNNIYNYQSLDLDVNLKENEFNFFNKDEIKLPISENNKVVYKSLRDIQTPNINRYYFNKYKKYKNKYLLLKNN